MRFFTWLLAFVFLFVARKSRELRGLQGLLGLCVLLAGLSAGRLSGALLNPAVALGVAASGGGLLNGLRYGSYELLGGLLAAAAKLLLDQKEERSKPFGAV